jgi:hypothetical protein
MSTKPAITFAALAFASGLGAFVGCSSSTQDGRSGEFGDAGLAACDHYFAALYSRCGGPTLPATETARLLPRFEQLCQNEAALPGSGVTAGSLEACAAALDISPCEFPAGPPAACNFHGSLSGGSPCADALQCEGGRCSGQQSFTSEGPQGPITCGACVPLAAVGQVCNAAGCSTDTICVTADTSAAHPVYTCDAISLGTVGTACDDLAAQCQTGLYCAAGTATCQALAVAGEPCGEGAPSYPGGCVAPLACGSSRTCSSSGSGGPCFYDLDCAPGLGCIPSGTSGICVAVSWVGPGKPCSGAARCLVGSCNFGGLFPVSVAPDGGLLWGTCPTVVPEGQSCTVSPGNGTTTCDTFSQCFEGTCALVDAVGCK